MSTPSGIHTMLCEVIYYFAHEGDFLSFTPILQIPSCCLLTKSMWRRVSKTRQIFTVGKSRHSHLPFHFPFWSMQGERISSFRRTTAGGGNDVARHRPSCSYGRGSPRKASVQKLNRIIHHSGKSAFDILTPTDLPFSTLLTASATTCKQPPQRAHLSALAWPDLLSPWIIPPVRKAPSGGLKVELPGVFPELPALPVFPAPSLIFAK